MLKLKGNSKESNSLIGLLFIGLIFIVVFFIGGNVSLLKQNISNWPKTKAEVTLVENRTVCDNPEQSGSCYSVFLIKYLYSVSGKKYIGQMEQLYTTSFFPGKIFDIYYKEDNPEFAFIKEKIPAKSVLYFPLIFGLIIIFSVIILWIYKKYSLLKKQS